MASVSVSTSKPTTARADALLLGVRTDDDLGEFADALRAVGFTGEKDQVAVVPAGDLAKVKAVVAVGLAAEPTAEELRRAAAAGLRAAPKGTTSLAVALHPAGVDEVTAVVEGLQLGSYRYETYKTPGKDADGKDKIKPRIDEITVLTPFARQTTTTTAAEQADIVSTSVNLARDWVNTPPRDLRPPAFADAIVAAAPENVSVSVWDEKRLAKEKCGGILSVGQGSDAPPRLVRLTYKPRKPVTHLALVGKGITFDSGGLSLKPPVSMQTMKCDMGGAAAVVAATFAIARLGLPIAVTAYACIAENLPSGSATRPGDVVTTRCGKTVEVLNTDAEGRMVLGDGLALAVESGADRIVDAATLTGAAMVALGDRTAAVLGNDDALRDLVLAAAESAGEPTWALPITEEMKGFVTSSNIADLRQIGPKPYGGTLFAAAFLREFVAEVPWAHLDIAGPAFNDGGVRGYTPTGGTGAGVRTIVRLARELAEA